MQESLRLHHKTLRVGLILAGVVILSTAIYLLYEKSQNNPGFPLDDAWIHQTYARNLAINHKWEYFPGQTSSGSTSPLWTLLLAIGYWIKIEPITWSYILGLIFLWGIAFIAEISIRKIYPEYQLKIPWIGILMALEWHHVWAADSGMETPLISLITLVVLLMILKNSREICLEGILVALAIWTRPDGILLLGPMIFAILLKKDPWKEKIRSLGKAGIGFGGLFGAYLAFNLLLSDTPWPNTFYAKQSEFAILYQQPFLFRMINVSLPIITGAGFLLIPGFIFTTFRFFRNKEWNRIAVILWILGYIIIYAWRLPVNYQHGRYMMPIIPVFLFLGILGFIPVIINPIRRIYSILTTSLKLAVGIVLLLFWGQGAKAFRNDVTFINIEMVQTAQWTHDNIPQGDLIAAHDIGALGYFGGHPILDIAGLVTPSVIPFIRDETELRNYLDRNHVEYLIAFPDWYPLLTHELVVVHTADAPAEILMGSTNMKVYKWGKP